MAETANETANGAVADAPVTEAGNAGQGDRGAARGRGGRTERGGRDRNPRRPRRNEGGRERVRPEFDQKIISIRRVTRVMAGGRRFSFSVAMVIGDKKGRVGVGIGKAGDTQLAIEKAVRDAKKHMITVPMNQHSQIAHDVQTKLSSSEVMIIPAAGRGLVAGSSVRTVLELAGVKDVTAKLLSRTKNKLNNARATIEALKLLKA
ncbi:30S ribosomal protein S5 [Candidatus Kaiserbacteria bacterium RIFCSPHIGHO2_01_FULL_46_22]|uniref:Small ribosomal subunit protein uS5 n=1 Tax=Candidatus Kaiserbacteria bacterium RIFCSPHIGHO2_01_FULL_46_22 TaxID=1798475 RepID=A0A1F6BXC4_9BACT|nr:MAG: 30S ribosomal protein S5 [Candidatus Kaiserbacteria bacterium RIFCSPHIGHO2_01_FULL_46_22]